MIKIKNASLQRLLTIYSKLMEADFDTTKESLLHIENATKLENLYKITEKARESIVKKYKLDGKNKDDKEVNQSANQDYIKVLMEDVEVDLSTFSLPTIESVNLKPIEIMLLKDLKLIKEENVQEVTQ